MNGPFRCLRRGFHQIASDFVSIVEVGPRDGLQNVSKVIPTEAKVEFVNRLSACGFRHIEIASFVSPKWVPQMGDSAKVFTNITQSPTVTYWAIVPNAKGFEAATTSGVKAIAVGTSASETFCRKNWNQSIEQSIATSASLLNKAQTAKMDTRAYISNVMGCPYEGEVSLTKVVSVVENVLSHGFEYVSLGDTNGVGTPNRWRSLLKQLDKLVPLKDVAVHCHDTYGQALPNILSSLECGVRIVDSSVAGLGGCPYAPGASGNVATEDLVYMLQGLGMACDVDLESLIVTGDYICGVIGKETESKVGRALLPGIKNKLNH